MAAFGRRSAMASRSGARMPFSSARGCHAPLSRVCYGSDAFGSPEPFYVSALLGKRALAQVLESLVDDGMLSPGEAQTAALQILSQNARELYGL